MISPFLSSFPPSFCGHIGESRPHKVTFHLVPITFSHLHVFVLASAFGSRVNVVLIETIVHGGK